MNTAQPFRATVWQYAILGMSLLMNLVLLFRLFWGPQSLISYQNLNDSLESIEDEIAVQDETNAALSREIRLLQTDSAYMERAIRQRLNFVRDNEIIYVFDLKGSANIGRDSENARKN